MRFRSLATAIITGALATGLLAAPAAAGAGNATVWVAHGIPGAVVDVCVGGNAVKRDFKYGQRFKASLPAATYTIRVRLAAHEDCKGAVVIKQAVSVTSGLNATAIAVVKGGTPQLALYINDTSVPTAALGTTLTLIHEAKAPTVDAWLAQTVRLTTAASSIAGAPSPTIAGLSRGDQAGPVAIPADVYTAWVSLPGTSAAIVGPSVHDLKDGRAYTVIVVGTDASNYRFIAFGQPISAV